MSRLYNVVWGWSHLYGGKLGVALWGGVRLGGRVGRWWKVGSLLSRSFAMVGEMPSTSAQLVPVRISKSRLSRAGMRRERACRHA